MRWCYLRCVPILGSPGHDMPRHRGAMFPRLGVRQTVARIAVRVLTNPYAFHVQSVPGAVKRESVAPSACCICRGGPALACPAPPRAASVRQMQCQLSRRAHAHRASPLPSHAITTFAGPVFRPSPRSPAALNPPAALSRSPSPPFRASALTAGGHVARTRPVLGDRLCG